MTTQSTILHSAALVRRSVAAAAVALALVLTLHVGAARAGELVNALADGTAMDGFDVVAYHTAGAPAKGSASHSVDYKGKTWLFASAANASAFREDPGRYEPQHNGWCSYAVSEGYGAEVDFVNGWSVIDGKLYLNWDANTRDAFLAKKSERISNAQENWPSVHEGLQDGSIDLYTHAGEGVDITHPQQLN